jgi:succinyl-diaminopimelate desuccinylase
LKASKTFEEKSMDHVEILKKLISFDTSVPPGNNYVETIDYLEPLFRQVGFQTEKVPIPPEFASRRNNRIALLCHRKDETKPRLLFYAHIDVVPAQGWDAFNPKVENGKMYGRGAADMKGSIPALLTALERCKDRPLGYNTSVMVTTDEEINQADQLRYIRRYLEPVKGAYFFDLDSHFGYVGIAYLGAMHMEILVRGKSVHSGLSNLGENAVEKAIPLMNALMKLKSKVIKRKSKIKAHPDTGLDYMVSRLNINMVQGGLKVNIIPDQCKITIDRRLIPEENIEEARKEIMDTLNSVPDVKWEIASEFSIPTTPPCDDPISDKLAGIMQQVIGEDSKYGEMGSGDLGNIVGNEWGGKQFGMGVIRTESNIHGKDEFVYLKDIENLAEIIYRFME